MRMLSIILFLSIILLSGCTVYTEKQSEAVSQNVYAVKDSLDLARVDLADFYANEATKFIKPPKHPVKINEIKTPNNRILIVPEKYKNDKVVVVGSSEYSDLLKDSQIKKQLEEDNKIKDKQLKANKDELVKQKEMSDKMVKDLNILQKKIFEKDLVILRLWVSLIASWILFAGAAYLRLKGVL